MKSATSFSISSRDYHGLIDGKEYNRIMLEECLRSIIDFQKLFGARFFLGEFLAVRQAVGADVYIDIVISIAEKYGWDWTYHACREWNGWNVEHVEDHSKVEKTSETTKRKEFLLTYFKKKTF